MALLLVLFFFAAERWERHHRVQARASRLYRASNTARVKVVFVTYQVRAWRHSY